MKFKTDDIGLYVALGLTGAGIGLLIGAFITSRLRKNEDKVEESMVMDPEEVKARVKIEARPYKPPHEERDFDGYTDEEKAIIEEINPTPMQFEMLRKGVITLEELRSEHQEYMKRVKLAEQTDPDEEVYSYNALYKRKKSGLGQRNWVDPDDFDEEDFDEMDENDPKSVKNEDKNDRFLTDDEEEMTDFDDLDGNIDEDDMVFIGNEYVLSKNLSNFDRIRQKSVKTKIIFDRSEDTWYTLSARGHILPVKSLDKYISEKGWQTVRVILIESGGPVYVQDLETEVLTEYDIEEEEDEN